MEISCFTIAAFKRKKEKNIYLVLEFWTANRVSTVYHILSVHISDLIGPKALKLIFQLSTSYRTMNRDKTKSMMKKKTSISQLSRFVFTGCNFFFFFKRCLLEEILWGVLLLSLWIKMLKLLIPLLSPSLFVRVLADDAGRGFQCLQSFSMSFNIQLS